MLREFRFGFDELLKFPLKRFWFLLDQVDRLRAEDEMRQLRLAGASGSSEAYQTTVDALKKEMGQIYVWAETTKGGVINADQTLDADAQFDKGGFEALKARLAAERRV